MGLHTVNVPFVVSGACAGNQTECWADHMKRTGVIVARQLKKHNQPRVQSLAMRRVRIAAMAGGELPERCQGTQILGRVCDMALRRNVEG